jgi:hypothetical protein
MINAAMFRDITDITIDDLRARTTMLHYFGLGFIQMKLGPTYRLHFYTKELPPLIAEEDVHNHRYGFTSTILHGTFEQDRFALTAGATHVVEDESCREGYMQTTAPRPCGIRRLATDRFTTGDTYRLTADEFHRVRAAEAITLLKRGPIQKELAQVVRRAGSQKLCPFSMKIPERELWEIVEAMLER